jgi:glutaredoxin
MMVSATRRYTFARCIVIAAATIAATGATAQEQIYRYVDKDGNVVYSDRIPPGGTTGVQAKRLGANIIENDELPLAARQAQERFPVTLYTFACGVVCTNAEALLNRRGVPFTTVNADTPQGSEQLSKATGELRVPVLQVGDKNFVKGFSEQKWQAALDEAGYPKAIAPRRVSAGRAPPEPAETAVQVPQTVGAPATGYPKQ